MHTQTQMVPVAAPMVPMAPAPLRRVSRGPFCGVCGLHMGNGAVVKVCGACARRRKGQKATLCMAELTRFARLARKHWTGTARELLTAPGGYRPTLYTLPHSAASRPLWSDAELKQFKADCREREQLANLYDRIQATRADARRACRE